MQDVDVPVIYQAVCCPGGDWTTQADSTIYDLERGLGTVQDRVLEAIVPRDDETEASYTPPRADQHRIEGIRGRTLRRTFRMSARAVALTHESPTDADSAAKRLRSVFASIGGETHTITGRVTTDDELYAGPGYPPGTQIFEAVCDRLVGRVSYDAKRSYLPWVPHESTGFIVAPEELPGFCLLGGAGLTPSGRRALATRSPERIGIPLPPPELLGRYRGPGMALGMPLTRDRQPYGHPLILPPAQQTRHVLVVGDTGSGKSVLQCTAMLTNTIATDGPAIVFDTKGGGTALEYLRAHFAAYGDLEDVHYFDFTRVLPALTFFDITRLLEAGVPHEEARSRKASHYEELLQGVMGAEQYGQAQESVKVLRNHVKALFDPIHGEDSFSHADLYAALRRTQEQRATPPVSDDRLATYFESLLERDRDIFQKVMTGAIGRADSIATDGRLGPLFEHTAENGEGARFDFSECISEDSVIVFDFGGMEAGVKRTLTLALLSNLWSALKARSQNTPESEVALVNVYLEEAADVADTSLVDTLLSQGRSFELSMTLGVQFPRQLDSPDPENETYLEALNETATFIVGNVSVRDDLAEVLATEGMPPEAVARRLSALRRGNWLVRPGSGFDEATPRPFLTESLPAPNGHPASDAPLSESEEARFQAALENAESRTLREAGLPQTNPDEEVDDESDTKEEDGDEVEDEESVSTQSVTRVDSLLPYTKRLPRVVAYDEQAHALRCSRCQNRYDPSIEGLRRAIECCYSMGDVKRDNIPVCEFNLKLAPSEITDSPWSIPQLLFLQAVYNAQQLRYDRLEYDIVGDSMLRLQEYVGIEAGELEELIEAGVLRRDGDHPHRLYSVPPEGRSVIGEAYREGIDYGHGAGDLEESAQHVCLNEAARRFLVQEFQEDPDSEVVEVQTYYELGDGHRLDCAGLDANGEIVVVVEAERINHDRAEAIVNDYDKMASCDPVEAIWVVLNREDAHEVLETLYNPSTGKPRVDKTYSRNTPPQQFRLNAPGATSIYPISYLQKELQD
ncbi:ATP-binding protein [Halobacterium wangiae]|uniref:ATP-binding protein n=1 Tax=Halobacterium wangiae TaxID=2902623 RepID=UPI001E5189F2|nr:DUF87 domain-containing protein [Halobacterium wangiae]